MEHEQGVFELIPLFPTAALSSLDEPETSHHTSRYKPKNHNFDDDDGAAPLPIFSTDKMPLRPLPVPDPFSPIPKTVLEWLLGSLLPFLAVIVAALVSHEIEIAYYSKKVAVTNLRRPILFSATLRTTLMLVAIVYLALHRQQEIHQQLWIKPPKRRWVIFILHLLVVLLLAPMLTLAIHDSCHIIRDGSRRGSTGPVYATMKTWSQAVPNMEGALPALTSQWEDLTNVSLLMPDPITFPLPNNGKGPNEERWNEVPYEKYNRDTNGMYMPFSTVGSFPEDEGPEMTLESTITTTTEVIAVQLRCKFANIESVSDQILHPDSNKHDENTDKGKTDRLLTVKVRDNDGCAATIPLHGQYVDKTTKTYQRTVVSELKLPLSFQGVILGQTFKKLYEILLEDNSPIIAFTPAWALYTAGPSSLPLPEIANEEQCGQRLAIAGTKRPILLADGSNENLSDLIQVASCEPEFNVADIALGVRRTREPPSFKNPFATASAIEMLSEPRLEHPNMFVDRIIKNGPLKSKWASLGTREDDALLRKAFVHGAGATSIHFDDQMVKEAIVGDYADIVRSRPQMVGSLVMAGRVLRRAFTSRLTTASELTLQELLMHRNIGAEDTEIKRRSSRQTDRLHVRCVVFQNTITFHVCLWLVGGIIMVLCIYHECYQDRADGRLWPLLSPAARALLLRRNSLRPILTEFYKGERLTLPKNLRLGVWATGGRPGVYQLGLHVKKGLYDTEEDSSSDRDSTFESLEESLQFFDHFQKALGRDDHLLRHILAPGAWAAFVVILYCVFQPLALTRRGFFRTQSEDKMAETWRLLGIETLSLTKPAPFMSNFCLRMVPSALILFCATYWIPRLYHFVIFREPWSAMLRKHKSAERSVTIDYNTTWFPLLYALRRGHQFIAVLAFGRIVAFFVPFFQMRLQGMFRYEVHTQFSSPKRCEASTLQWANGGHLIQDDPAEFDLALKGLVDTFGFRHQWPRWSSSEVTLLPLNLSKVDIKDNDKGRSYKSSRSRHFRYSTWALRTGLVCEREPVEVIVNQSTSTSDISSYGIEQLIVTTGSSQKSPIFGPCKAVRPAPLKMGPTEAPKSSESVCIRWLLNDNSKWIIAIAHGSAFWAQDRSEMRFSHVPSAIGLSCRSSLVQEPGHVLLSSNQVMFSDSPSPVDYQPEPDSIGSSLDWQIVAAVERGLNASNSRLAVFKDIEDGIMATESLVHTDHFAGDLMSWLLYRRILEMPTDLSAVQSAASTLFAAFVAHLAHQDWIEADGKIPLLTQRAPDPTMELQPVMLHTVRRPVDWFAATFLILFVVFCAGLLTRLPWLRRKYQLVPSPEPLINGLLLLAGGSLVSHLDSEEAPEIVLKDVTKGSTWLSRAYRTVEGWGLHYMLEPLDWTDEQPFRLTVNTVQVQDEDIQRVENAESPVEAHRQESTGIDSELIDWSLSTSVSNGNRVDESLRGWSQRDVRGQEETTGIARRASWASDAS